MSKRRKINKNRKHKIQLRKQNRVKTFSSGGKSRVKRAEYVIAIRRQLQNQFPNLRADEIEAKLKAIVARGMRASMRSSMKSAHKQVKPTRKQPRAVPQKMKFEIITGPPACGKTTYFVNRAIRLKGLYLLVFPICELIQEQIERIKASNGNIFIDTVTSDNSRITTSLDLIDKKNKIEKSGLSHAVIITTHETLIRCGLDQFSGWNVCIDEAIATSQSGHAQVNLCQDWLNARAEITPSPFKGWSYLHIPKNRYKESDLREAASLSKISKMILLAAMKNRLLINASSIGKTKILKWCYVWQLSRETHLKSLTISYSSGGCNISLAADNALNKRFKPSIINISNKRTGQPKIKIGYFTDTHVGTTVFWESFDGKGVLNKICRFLMENLTDDSYWSGNPCVRDYMVHWLPGQMITSQCAGLNSYRHARSCAFIYSAKATYDDSVLMEILGLNASSICASREHEAIFQFAFRGVIRDPAYNGPYQVYVYSKSQAEELERRLQQAGFTDVTVCPIHSAGVMSVERAESSPPKGASRPESPEEVAARKAKRKEKARLSRASKATAAGRKPGKPGRPPKPVGLTLPPAPRKRGRPPKNR